MPIAAATEPGGESRGPSCLRLAVLKLRATPLHLGRDKESDLTRVAEVARDAERTARRVVELRQSARTAAQGARLSSTAPRLLDHLVERPVINANAARDQSRRVLYGR